MLDGSMRTGEPVPVEAAPGDSVVGATVNAGGRIDVRGLPPDMTTSTAAGAPSDQEVIAQVMT
ncbi:hypothetical protein [Mycobacterium marinum]|uniref:hypothetical protein n=1 Tax=Mycobacterium marinum TaxID=1781 RepID=UPI0014089D6E|nr:hypothetical protein [Mycobacterium marinum]